MFCSAAHSELGHRSYEPSGHVLHTDIVSLNATCWFRLTTPDYSCSWALVTVLVNRLVVNQCRERHRLRQSIHFKADLTPLDLLCTPTATQHNEDLELSAMSVGVNVDVIQETRSVRSLRSLRSLRSVTSIHL